MVGFEGCIRERFAQARVLTDPCPHLVIEDILPPNLYRSIERDSPDVSHWLYAAVAATFWRRLAKARKEQPTRRWSLVPGAALEAMRAALPEADPLDLEQPALDCNEPLRASPGLNFRSKQWRAKYLPVIRLVNTLVLEAFEPYAQPYMSQLIAAGIFTKSQKQVALVHEFCRRMRGWTIEPHTHDIGQATQWMLYFLYQAQRKTRGLYFTDW